jgi:hypothetical protein
MSQIDQTWLEPGSLGRSRSHGQAAGAAWGSDAFIRRAVAAIALVVTVLSIWLAVRYSGQPLLDIHGFRETQTALTSVWLLKNGFRLAYETPVLGKPWSIPFEFPLYQYLVAQISMVSGVALERTGRLVNYAFLLACLAPAALIARRLLPGVWKAPFLAFAALLLSSPMYLYWGRSFMIEMAALFFALCFVHYALLLIQQEHRTRNFVLCGAFLTLALLQKLTTVLPDLIVIGSTLLVVSRSQIRLRSVVMWKAIVAFGLPLAIGYAWVRYTDAVKGANIVAAGHYTSTALRQWNFGTLAARFSRSLWVDVIWERTIMLNVAGLLGVSLILAALLCADRKLRIVIALCLALFLSHFLIFENLHFVHSYYQVSTGIFLIAALALSIHAVAMRFPLVHRASPAILAALVAMNFYCFAGTYFPVERQLYGEDNQTLAVSALLRARTSPDRPIIVYGYDWSSEVAYYSQRRALTVPDVLPDRYGVVDDPARYVGELPSAIVACGADRVPALASRILKSFKPTDVSSVAGCDVYLS